jgi:hypothetical protein
VSVVLRDGAPADTPDRVRTALQHALVAVGPRCRRSEWTSWPGSPARPAPGRS